MSSQSYGEVRLCDDLIASSELASHEELALGGTVRLGEFYQRLFSEFSQMLDAYQGRFVDSLTTPGIASCENVVSLYMTLAVPEDGFSQGAGQVALAHFVDAVRGVLTTFEPLGRVPKAANP